MDLLMKTEKEKIIYRKYQKYIKSKPFKELKEKILERDNYKCQFCGRTLEEIADNKKITLQAHHNSYENLGKCNGEEMNDIITLCSVCHNACHKAKSNLRRFSDKSKINDNLI